MGSLVEFLSSSHSVILFMIMTGYLALGDFLTKKTKALIPSILVFAILLGASSWAGLIPPKIAELSGIYGPLSALASVLMVLNMGTTMNIKDVTSNWKIALVAFVALIGVAIGCVTIGAWIWGWDAAVVSAPIVGGGIVAMLEMQNAALELGRNDLAAMAVLILTLQSFPAFVIIPPLFKRVMRKDLEETPKEEVDRLVHEKKEIAEAKPPYIPEKYWTSNTIFFFLSVVGTIAVLLNMLSKQYMGNYAISVSIFALLLSIIATELRLLPRNATVKAGANGLIFTFVLINAFQSVATASLAEIISLLVPIIGMIFVGIIGILVFSVLLGKFVFKYDWKLSFIMGLNCLLGFPLNYLLVLESIDVTTEDEDEKKYLTEKYVPMMLVAGFVTITIGSVLLAGFMKGFLV